MRLIDADALINDILTDYGCDPKYIADETIDGLKPYTDQLILERIGLQPTIDAVPVVHGEWISDRLVTTNGGTYGVRRCSRCEAYYQDIGYGWDYCPNCGARMGERRES